jgi:hypothetical protein
VQGRWSLQILDSTKSTAVLIGHALPVDVVILISLGLHIPYFSSQELHYSRQSRQGQSDSTGDAPSCSSIGGLHQLPRADHQPSFVRVPAVVYLACFSNRCASKATPRQFSHERGNGSTNCEINRNLRHCSRRVICLFSPARVGQVLPEFSILLFGFIGKPTAFQSKKPSHCASQSAWTNCCRKDHDRIHIW